MIHVRRLRCYVEIQRCLSVLNHKALWTLHQMLCQRRWVKSPFGLPASHVKSSQSSGE